MNMITEQMVEAAAIALYLYDNENDDWEHAVPAWKTTHRDMAMEALMAADEAYANENPIEPVCKEPVGEP
jgi:hypothetical protein